MEMTDLIFWFGLALEMVAIIVLSVVFVLAILDCRKQKKEDDKWKRHEAMQLIRGTITPFIGLINAAEKQRNHSTEGHG